jgi:AraC-like DNA-binding protein
MARPQKLIDVKQVEELAAIDCTYEEMAAVLDCSTKTLKRRFGDLINKGRETGKASLRRAQHKAAMGGNATMMIWLGKQRLGQTDDRGAKDGPADPQETARQVREHVRAMREADGLAA